MSSTKRRTSAPYGEVGSAGSAVVQRPHVPLTYAQGYGVLCADCPDCRNYCTTYRCAECSDCGSCCYPNRWALYGSRTQRCRWAYNAWLVTEPEEGAYEQRVDAWLAGELRYRVEVGNEAVETVSRRVRQWVERQPQAAKRTPAPVRLALITMREAEWRSVLRLLSSVQRVTGRTEALI